jgi:PhnB protein
MPNPPTDLPRVVAHLIYEDVDAAVAFMGKAFGFQERLPFRHPTDSGRISRTQLQVLDSVITVGEPSIHGVSPRQGVSSMLYVYVEDVDEHFARAVAAGAEIVQDVDDVPWGDRRYQAADPEGHQWTFATHVSDAVHEH